MLNQYLKRYRDGEPRSAVFGAMIIDLARTRAESLGRAPTILDIGCGKGFDEDTACQEGIAKLAGHMIGVEPDRETRIGPHFHEAHASSFEDAKIATGSVDLAYCFMVLEHIGDTERFWAKLHHVLAPGGIFIGITPDARHPFCTLSAATEKLGVKNWYMKRLGDTEHFGKYQNFPTHYRANTPRSVARQTRQFSALRCQNFAREGVLNYYLPRPFHRAAEWVDRAMIGVGLPGTIMVVELTR